MCFVIASKSGIPTYRRSMYLRIRFQGKKLVTFLYLKYIKITIERLITISHNICFLFCLLAKLNINNILQQWSRTVQKLRDLWQNICSSFSSLSIPRQEKIIVFNFSLIHLNFLMTKYSLYYIIFINVFINTYIIETSYLIKSRNCAPRGKDF